MNNIAARSHTARLGQLGAVGALAVAAMCVSPQGLSHASAASYARPALAAPLRVVASSVLDARGKTVVLGGIHRTGYTRAVGDDLNPVEADAIARWSSMVRIETNASLVTDSCSGDPAAYLARLDQAVSLLTTRNVVALIDLHESDPRDCGRAHFLPLPARAKAVAFWSTVASRYASNPLVAFELWNEPHDITDDVWLNGGVVTSPAAGTYDGAGMQELYDTVSQVTSSNLIFVEGNGAGSDPTAVNNTSFNVDRLRTVLAMHAYTCVQQADTACINDPAKRQFPASTPGMAKWDTVARTRAVVVTETGFPDQHNATWFSTAAQWSLQHTPAIGIVGFADDGKWNGSPFAITTGAPSWSANQTGQPLVDFMTQAGVAKYPVNPPVPLPGL